MRGVREEKGVSLALDEACEKWPRADDAWQACMWVVARDPECGEAITESGLTRAFVFDGARSIGMPSIEVIYEVQQDLIVVHYARFYEAPHGQGGIA